MSFILDALKKSEAERQRKSTPGVADIPDARAPTGIPRWLWLLAGLLAVNLSVLVVILLRPGAEAGTASITQPLELPESMPPASFSDLVAEAKENQRELATAPTRERESEPRRDEPPAAATPGPAATPVDIGTISTFDELRARGELMLPDLHLDLHVYAERPADRFIVVNMSRYTEGAVLAEGPVVREILPHGIVLEHQGTEFFLPRQ